MNFFKDKFPDSIPLIGEWVEVLEIKFYIRCKKFFRFYCAWG
jgi:hypothetical protein